MPVRPDRQQSSGTDCLVIARCLLGIGLVALALTLSAAPESAHAASQRTTFLLSTANGTFPNGPSRNPAISHDQRFARYAAYESDASNIVAGDTNNETDIFLVSRASPFGESGSAWQAGRTKLISQGMGGAPADGASYRPALDGDAHHPPQCVAFISDASNLVPGDTNGKPDGFVYNTHTGQITRVTVNSAGQQANGSTFNISISGHCLRVAFTSDATNLQLTQTNNLAWSGLVTSAVRSGTRQVYTRILGGHDGNEAFRNLTFLVSASADGAPGNHSSDEARIARSGKAVAFSSTATNLTRGDETATSDIYRRTIYRKFVHLGSGRGVQTLESAIGLVSASRSGRAGNGASTHPTITDDGRLVAFETDASNILTRDTNGVSDIVRARLGSGRPKAAWVSWTPTGGIGNGASHHPVISDAGDFVLFDSDASNLRPSPKHNLDPNGVKDVFLWNAPTRNVSLESRDAANGYLNAPSQHPATSSRGNYVPFESADPLIDLSLASKVFPNLVEQPSLLDMTMLPALPDPDLPATEHPDGVRAAGFAAPSEPASIPEVTASAASVGEQVYMRYLGPK
jgi:hypothetical protein